MGKRVLIITPELYPQIQVGGLGKVVAGLVKALSPLGPEVKVVAPKTNIYQPLSKPTTKKLYWQLGYQARLYCQKKRWWPDWVWVHDWGGVWAMQGFCHRLSPHPRFIWTIHSPLLVTNYGAYDYAPDEGEFIDWGDSFFDFASLVREGIRLSAWVTTVSSSYSRRLATHPWFKTAKTIVAIENGIDPEEWDPKNDPHLGFHWQGNWLEFKQKNKQVLQRIFDLPPRPVPLYCFVSRLVWQKGVDLLVAAMEEFLAQRDVQFIVVGEGSWHLGQRVAKLKTLFPRKVGIWLRANFTLPHQVFAGADFLVLPSRSEPFGLVVAESRRYGVVPIVRLVDGLQDQVKAGIDGFGFRRWQKEALLKQLHQAYQSWQSNYWHSFWQQLALRVATTKKVVNQWLQILAS